MLVYGARNPTQKQPSFLKRFVCEQMSFHNRRGRLINQPLDSNIVMFVNVASMRVSERLDSVFIKVATMKSVFIKKAP